MTLRMSFVLAYSVVAFQWRKVCVLVKIKSHKPTSGVPFRFSLWLSAKRIVDNTLVSS